MARFILALPLILPLPAFAVGTVVLPPSGGDDTATLAAAFEATTAAGPGSTLELLAGVYHVSQPLLVRGFHGTWRGAGIGQTILEIAGAGGAPFPLADFGVVDPAHPTDPPLHVAAVFLFVEVDGRPATDLNVSDLTFQLHGESEPWLQPGLPYPWNSIGTVLQFLPRRPTAGAHLPGRTDVRVEVDRIEVVGELISNRPEFFPVIQNLFNFLGAVGGPPGGNELSLHAAITRSQFDFCDRMVILANLVDSNLVVGGNRALANDFRAGTNAFNFINLHASTVDVSYNRLSTQSFVLIQQVAPPTAESQFSVRHNDVKAAFFTDYWPSAAIWILDLAELSGDSSAAVAIEGNSFVFETDLPFGPTEGSGLSHDPLASYVEGVVSSGILVRNNRFSGPVLEAAIELGVDHSGAVDGHPPLPNRGAVLRGNAVELVSAPVARIWLGPGTSDSTVIGNPLAVLDQGNGNHVAGN